MLYIVLNTVQIEGRGHTGRPGGVAIQMSTTRDVTRERILDSTVELMLETGDVRRVTMRAVAGRAGVGLGAINYHFQTKENLVNLAVRGFIRTVIAKWTAASELSDADSPRVQFERLLRSSADFIAAYPRVSRISILFDAEYPAQDDNTSAVIQQLIPFAERALGQERRHLARTVCGACVASMQLNFLRCYERGEQPSFFDVEARAALISSLVNVVLGQGGDDE